MKKLILISLLFVSSSFVLSQEPIPVPIPKEKEKKITITPLNPKGGDLLSIVAGVDDPVFEHEFTPGTYRQIGKMLVVALPNKDNDIAQSYTVRCIYYDLTAKKIIIEKIEIKVAGKIKPKPDEKTDTIKQLRIDLQLVINSLDKISKSQNDLISRVTLLEEKPRPPPPPVDQFLKALQDAYNLDKLINPKSAIYISKLSGIYRNANLIVDNKDTKFYVDISDVMKNAIGTAMDEPDLKMITILPNVRKALGVELAKTLPVGPASTVPLTLNDKMLINNLFGRVSLALDGVK